MSIWVNLQSSTHGQQLEDGDTDSETDLVIALQNLSSALQKHYIISSRTTYRKEKSSKISSLDMATGVPPAKQKSEKERKPGLKQRLFGTRTSKTSKGI